MKNNKTTKKHFKLFKEECEKWIEVFGLKAWRVDITHDVDKDINTLATCRYDVVNRTTTLQLNLYWGVSITNYLVCQSAFHEVCELLLCNIRTLADTRFITRVEVDEEVHAVIRTLENILFDKDGS